MRVTAAVLMAALSCACTEPDVPKYVQNPGGPTIQIPTTLRLSVLQGTGNEAKNAYVTASLRDQDGHGIADRMLTFSSSKGTLDPASAKTTVNGDAKTTVTHGTDVTVSVSGAGLTASMDVAIAVTLSVTLSSTRAEKNVPVTLTANVNGDSSPPLRFLWNFGDGQTAQTDVATVTHTWADDGRVTVAVRVTDAIDRTGTASLSITVRDNPEPPAPPEPPPSPPPPPAPAIQVTVSASPSPAIAGQSTTLTAIATPQNSAPPVTSFDWDCLDDGVFESTTAGNTFACTYPAAGSRTARVRAHGGTVTGEGTVTITVLADAPFFVSVSAVPSPVKIGVATTFTATVSVAPPAMVPSPLVWEWDFEGGDPFDLTVSGPNPNNQAHTYATTGAIVVRARASHAASGRSAVGTLNLTVVP